MRRAALTLAVIVFAAMLAITVAFVVWWPTPVRSMAQPVRQKQFDCLIAEGVRYRDFEHLGFDSVSFASCGIEKRRRGAVTFGAFNVLVVEGLVLNLPKVRKEEETVSGPGVEGLAETFFRAQGGGRARFSGLRVHGLTVNHYVSNRVERIVFAEQAENGLGEHGLQLRKCVVSLPDGSETRVSDARLIAKPRPTFVYTRDGVERRVDL